MDGRSITRLVAALLASAVVVAGCGDDGDDGVPQTGDREAAADTTAPAEEPLQVLVTNDDGVGAQGIDVLVTALSEVEGIEVTVVAPAEQQSGTGGNTTDGPLDSGPARTVSGHEATAVDGFPADTVRVAFDELGLTPDVVVSGINEGQNLGGVIEVSGTVGAARAAARRGVPAVAVSQGRGEDPDFEVAADLVVAWLGENRAAIEAGTLSADTVLNLNVPTCDEGELRGTVEVPLATEGDPVGVSDCTATTEGHPDDISAFTDGFATTTAVPLEPATPAA